MSENNFTYKLLDDLQQGIIRSLSQNYTHTSYLSFFRHTTLLSLAIRKYYCGKAPCLAKNCLLNLFS